MHDSVTVRMAAAPERIWDVVTDVTSIGKYSSETTGAEWVGGATGPALGARFRGHVNRNGWGLKYSTVCRIETYDLQRDFAFTVIGPGGIRINTWRYQLEPVDGGTDVTESFRLQENPALRLYWMLAGWTRGQTNRDNMRETLERIRAEVESEPTRR